MLSFSVSLTSKCNLNCLGCHNTGVGQHNSIEHVKEQVDFAVKWGATTIQPCVAVSEPLLYPANDFKEFVDYCDSIDEIEAISIYTSLAEIDKQNIYSLASSKKIHTSC